jgi:predicted nucleotidyltransferase
MDALEAVKIFLDQRFPECSAAFLAGSVIRGEGTSTSDLDIVIITA